jgi:hypothetical protein
VVVADVNGDGTADLVVALQNDPGGAHVSSGLVGVLLGRGDGTYGTATTYDSAGMEPFAGALGDTWLRHRRHDRRVCDSRRIR